MNKKILLNFVLPLADIVLMYAALFLVLAFRYGDFSVFPGPQSREFFFHFIIIHAVWLVLLYAFDFYDFSRPKGFVLLGKNAALFALLAFSTGAVYFYLNLHSLIAPKRILFGDVCLFSLFVFARVVLASRFAVSRRLEKRIAVAGWCPEMEELARKYLLPAGYKIVAVFRPNALEKICGADVFVRESDFIGAVRDRRIGMVVFATPAGRADLPEMFSGAGINTKVIGLPSFYEELTGKVPLNLIDKLWFMEIAPFTLRKNYVNAKRIFDIFFAAIGLVFAVIIFPFVYLAIKVDSPGPVLYVQKRKGKNGKVFNFYKFRSMYASDNQYSVWRVNDDEQITRAGKMLRKTHIDEFPQLINILRGDISFVGPRPEWEKLAVDYEKKIPLYRYRYLVRPGFTGWAQINYKASASVDEAREKFEYDLYYIKNRSFLLDISILLKTAQLFFR